MRRHVESLVGNRKLMSTLARSWLRARPEVVREKTGVTWAKNYLQSSSLLSKLVQNTGWLFFEKAIRYSLSLFVGLYVARYLGPHDFGRLSYVISFIEIGLPIAALGFSEILVQEFTQKTFNEDELLGTGLLMRLLGTLLVYSTLYVMYALFFIVIR